MNVQYFVNVSYELRSNNKIIVLYCIVLYMSTELAALKLTIYYTYVLSYDVAVFQWITSCHKNRMTTRVITLLREYVTSLTTSVTTM